MHDTATWLEMTKTTHEGVVLAISCSMLVSFEYYIHTRVDKIQMTMLCYPCSKKWGAPITSRSTNLLIDWLINRWLQLFKLFKATNGENLPLVREEPVELDR